MKKKIIILSIIIAIGVIAAGGVYFLYPQYQLYQKYQAAIETYEAGDVAGAITQFQNLNGFYDSEEWVQKCEYTFADQYIANNNYDEAFAIYENYQDADNMNQCQYQKAVYCTGQKKYQEALAIFENLTGYEDADEKAKDCNYSIAVNYFDKKKYSKALAIFKQLGEYKESQNMIQNCYKKLMFSRFDYDGFREMLCDHASSKSDLKDILELLLAERFQLNWYEGDSKNQLVINQSTINGKPYGIISCLEEYDGEWVTHIKYFYFDNPEKELECAVTYYTDYKRVTDITVCDMKFENKNYCSVENTVKEEIQSELAILEQQDEAERKKEQLLSAIYEDVKEKTEYHFGNRTVLDRALDPLEFKFPSLDNVFIVEGNDAIQMQFTVGYRSAYDAILDDIIGDNSTYCTVTATYSVDYNTLTYKQMNINYAEK